MNFRRPRPEELSGGEREADDSRGCQPDSWRAIGQHGPEAVRLEDDRERSQEDAQRGDPRQQGVHPPAVDGHRPIAHRVGQGHQGKRRQRREENEDSRAGEPVAHEGGHHPLAAARPEPGQGAADDDEDRRDRRDPAPASQGSTVE